MSRFAVNPKWLIYLPPTMSPSATSEEPGLLEHPAEAFAYYRQAGVPRVVCEEKHMGSRAVVIVCRDEDAARSALRRRRRRRRHLLHAHRQALLRRRRARVRLPHASPCRGGERQPLRRFESDWLLLDCELMPWSAKAQELLPPAVRSRRRRSRCRPERNRRRARPGGDAVASTSGRCWSASAYARRTGVAIRGRLSPLLLARARARRPQARPLPPARDRRDRPRRQGPPLAHGDARRALRR